MAAPALADETDVRTSPATARPLLFGAMAALSAGAAAIHFAVTFEHFSEYSLYGVFFLVLAWAQLVWPVILIALPFLTWNPARARPARFQAGWSRSGLTPLAARRVAAWLWLGIAGNAGVLVIYFSSRSLGLPIGPDTKTVEAWGALTWCARSRRSCWSSSPPRSWPARGCWPARSGSAARRSRWPACWRRPSSSSPRPPRS